MGKVKQNLVNPHSHVDTSRDASTALLITFISEILNAFNFPILLGGFCIKVYCWCVSFKLRSKKSTLKANVSSFSSILTLCSTASLTLIVGFYTPPTP